MWWLWVACSSALEDGQCQAASDCGEGLACLAPDYDPGCGTYDDGCAGTGYLCGTDQYCAEVADGCVAAECRNLCTDDAGCDADETCDVSSAECDPRSCEQGFDCGAQSICDLERGDEHGCLRLTCDDDASCPEGSCVGGRCFDTLGRCGSDEPPP